MKFHKNGPQKMVKKREKIVTFLAKNIEQKYFKNKRIILISKPKSRKKHVKNRSKTRKIPDTNMKIHEKTTKNRCFLTNYFKPKPTIFNQN